MQAFTFLRDVNDYKPLDAFIGNLSAGITCKDQLLQLIYQSLNLPEYFGFNWDALCECLRDFHWIHEKHIILIHQAFPSFKEETLVVYLEILSEACLDWKASEDHRFEAVFPSAEEERISLLLAKKPRSANR